jgi:hypothetical protein
MRDAAAGRKMETREEGMGRRNKLTEPYSYFDLHISQISVPRLLHN